MGLRNWGLGKVTGYIGNKTQGYKTKAGGVGLFLLGIVGIMGHIWPDVGLPPQGWDVIFGEFAAGLAAFGIGGKIERAREDIRENTEITKASVAPSLEQSVEPEKWNGKIPGQFP